MPLYRPHTSKSGVRLGIWQIAESYSVLHDMTRELGFNTSDQHKFQSELKRKQWLAARVLIRSMDGSISEISYNSDGSPAVNTRVHISFSHSHFLVAALTSASSGIGVDIQYFNPKIENIAAKFASPDELSSFSGPENLEKLTVAWSAKEAVYKKMKISGLNFRSEIEIQPFEIAPEGNLVAAVNRDGMEKEIALCYEILGDYTLVYTIIL